MHIINICTISPAIVATATYIYLHVDTKFGSRMRREMFIDLSEEIQN